MNIKTPIVDGLNKYLSENHKPWHMPGHKRKGVGYDGGESAVLKSGVVGKEYNMVENIIQRVQAMDVTEVPGLDDLHCPEDMIRESEEQLKKIYGTAASFYLVNGSTCGIFAAIAACGRGGIIAADNCHKSVRNAAELMGINISYVKTERVCLNSIINDSKKEKKSNIIEKNDLKNVYNPEQIYKDNDYVGDIRYQLRGYVSPKELEKSCKAHPDATAVVITSPTYEGIISNIEAISKVTEKYGKYLIVDEAHGAHLPFMDKNMSAIYNGADVVIQSLHKTLASLTQTAILHVTDKAVTKNLHIREDMRRYLSFMMSSSPSYILLASMELAVTDAAKNAGMDISNNAVKDEITGHIIDGNSEDIHNETEKFETNVNQSYIDGIVCGRKNGFDKYTERIKNFRIKCEKLENLRVFAGGEGYDIDITRIVIYQKYISGPELEKMLAEENIVVEMSGLDYVVLISSYVDNEADFVDLYAALEKIDGEIGKKSEKFTMGECGNMSSAFDTESEQTKYSKNNCICLEKLKAGDIAPADFYVYPPGIPIIAKGELITIEALEEIRSLSATGKKIYIS